MKKFLRKQYFSSIVEYSFQSKPLYEAALSNYINGNHSKTKYYIKELKSNLKSEGKFLSKEYIELTRKEISLYKNNENSHLNIENINEIDSITYQMNKGNFFNMQEDIINNVIYMINNHPVESVDYITKAKDYFPQMFESIFQFYIGTSYLLNGEDISKGVNILKENLPSVEDNDFKGYYLNNTAVGLYWLLSKKVKVNFTKEKMSYEMVQEISKELMEILGLIKHSLVLSENLNFDKISKLTDYESNLKKDLSLPNANIKELISNEKTFNQIRTTLLEYLLSTQVDLKEISKGFLSDYNLFKQISLFKGSVSSYILFNLSEIYFNTNDFKKALLYINYCNHLFKQNDNKRHFLKAMSLMSYIDYKINRKHDEVNKVFLKLISEIKDLDPSSELSYIYRQYGEFLLESNPNNPLIPTYFKNADMIDEVVNKYTNKGFAYRKSMLIFPKE